MFGARAQVPPIGSPRTNVDAFGRSDIGRARDRNEDRFRIADLPDKLLVVADGVGGNGGGDIASGVAVEAVVDHLRFAIARGRGKIVDLPAELSAGLRFAAERVLATAAADGMHPHMATTLTAAYVARGAAFVAHAGDSRAYLFRDGRITRLTRDHTLAELLGGNAFHNTLYNSIGGIPADKLIVDLHRVDLQAGDTLLLCTDGLTLHLDDAAIVRHLHRRDDARTACDALVDAALAEGGKDNIAAIVALV
jgi:protein phosphatase